MLRRWIDNTTSGRGLPLAWEDVGAQHIRAFMAKHAPKPARTHRMLASWRKFWKFMTEVQKVQGMQPGPSELKRPKMGVRLPKFLTVPDVARLLDVAHQQASPRRALRDWAILAFLYGTGARISEAVNLTFDKIDYSDGLPVAIRVIGKGNKERQVNLSSTAQRSGAST